MNTSGVFTVHQYPILCNENKPFRLVIFGDVHRDSPNHAKRSWQDDLKLLQSYPKDSTYFLGMGDYFDNASASERSNLVRIGPDMHETIVNDLSILAQSKVKAFAKEIDFMRGRLVGLVNGNHFFNFQDGTNTDQRLCGLLDCKYLGVSSFIRLAVTSKRNSHHSLDIWVHHGKGAARLVGGSINRVDQMREAAEADLYVMGHDHNRMAVPAKPRLFLRNTSRGGLEVKQRQSYLIRSGSYLASYEDGQSNYNVDEARNPCSIGHVELEITPRTSTPQHQHNWEGFKIIGRC